MLVSKFFSFFFGIFENIVDFLPQLPDLDIFKNEDITECFNYLVRAFEILGYFLPVPVILTLIAAEIVINNFNIVSAVFYRIKHMIPFF